MIYLISDIHREKMKTSHNGCLSKESEALMYATQPLFYLFIILTILSSILSMRKRVY